VRGFLMEIPQRPSHMICKNLFTSLRLSIRERSSLQKERRHDGVLEGNVKESEAHEKFAHESSVLSKLDCELDERILVYLNALLVFPDIWDTGAVGDQSWGSKLREVEIGAGTLHRARRPVRQPYLVQLSYKCRAHVRKTANSMYSGRMRYPLDVLSNTFYQIG